MAKGRKVTKIKNRKTVLAAQEIKFAKILAGNDKKLRDLTLKKLRKWLTFRSQSSTPFTDADFMCLWKGLFYCMWMSDKPLIQEECAEHISNLIHCFPNGKVGLQFFTCFLRTMSKEWFGIDQLRLDKFLMLIRRVLRQAIRCIQNNNWNLELIKLFGVNMSDTVLRKNETAPLGLFLQISEIYLEELAKVSNEELDPTMTTEFLRPFASYLAVAKDDRQIRHIMKHIFRHLLHQSNEGIDYQERFRAWQSRGFPGGSIDCIQKIEDDGSDCEDASAENTSTSNWEIEDATDSVDGQTRALDPRAGKVHVILPQIRFDANQIFHMLQTYKFDKDSNSKSRKAITRLLADFQLMEKGVFPLGMKSVSLPTEEEDKMTDIQEAAIRLLEFEGELFSERKLSKSQKRKLKKQSNEIVLETNDQNAGDIKDRIAADNIVDQIDEEDIIEEIDDECTPSKSVKLCSSGNFEEFCIKSEDGLLGISMAQNNRTKQSKPLTKGKKRKAENKEIQPIRLVNGNSFGDNEDSDTDTFTEGTLQCLDMGTTEKEVCDKAEEVRVETLKSVHDVLKVQKKRIKPITLFEKISTNNVHEISINNMVTSSVANLFEKKSKKVMPNKKQVKKKLGIKKPHQRDSFMTPPNKKSKVELPETPGSSKKVIFALNKNMAQETREYRKQLLSSPAIPFDATKKPTKPVIKPNFMPGPINPFYKLKKTVYLDPSFI